MSERTPPRLPDPNVPPVLLKPLNSRRGYRITAPHFVAGVEVDDRGRVTKAAPILRWAHGWSITRLTEYAREKGWGIEALRGKQ